MAGAQQDMCRDGGEEQDFPVHQWERNPTERCLTAGPSCSETLPPALVFTTGSREGVWALVKICW